MPSLLDKELREHPKFVEVRTPKEGDTLYVFSITEEEREGVVEPFKRGEYSKMDRKYVERFFPNQAGHRLYPNRLVCDKSDLMREAIETELGVHLPDNAEVWSKPKMEEEVYGYTDKTQAELVPMA